MSPDVLGGRVNDDVGTMLDRPDQSNTGGVVDDQRNAVLVGDLGNSLEVRDVQLRISHRFQIDGAGLRSDGVLERRQVGGIYELYLPSQMRESVVEKLIGPAVQVVRGNYLVSRAGDRQ